MSLAALHHDIEQGASRLHDPFLFGLRLFWGAQLALSGAGKLGDLGQTAATFAGWGFPAPGVNALLAGGTELAGGTLLVLGLATRPAALLLSDTMLVALGTAHRAQLLAATAADLSPLLTALPTTFLLASLVTLFVGPGGWSLDSLVGVRPARRALATPEVAA